MGKKRRERDRPKAAHDASYHPNKRVQLTYESDEELVDGTGDHSFGTGFPTAVETATVDYRIEEYPEDDGDGARNTTAHPTNHDVHVGFAEGPEQQEADDAHKAKEDDAAGNDDSLWTRGARKNSTTGQWAVLGSLAFQNEDERENEDYDSTEEEAMAYLRSVR